MTYRTLVLLALAGMSTGLAPSLACAEGHEHDEDVRLDEADQEAAAKTFPEWIFMCRSQLQECRARCAAA